MSSEYDLNITAGDLAFGLDDEPAFLSGDEVIAQDVKHRLQASGVAEELIGDESLAGTVALRIAATVEEDKRIAPGSATVEQTGPAAFTISARTLSGATITL